MEMKKKKKAHAIWLEDHIAEKLTRYSSNRFMSKTAYVTWCLIKQYREEEKYE